MPIRVFSKMTKGIYRILIVEQMLDGEQSDQGATQKGSI